MSNSKDATAVDFSPGATTVAFDPIVPPVRIPVPASEDDDRAKGEWVLAFKDDQSWRRAWQACEVKISEQCEMGARMGCSISAAKACRTPWWKHFLVFIKAAHDGRGEQDSCEEREMIACLTSSKDTCMKYARDTCEPVFADARIVEPHVTLDRRFTGPPFRKRWTSDVKTKNVQTASDKASSDDLVSEKCQSGSSEGGLKSGNDLKKPTTYRGRKLMTTESMQGHWDGPSWSERTEASESSQLEEGGGPIDGWEGGLIRPKLDGPTSAQSAART